MNYDVVGIGQRIRERRIEMKLSQEELAHRLEIANASLGRIELEKTYPRYALLLKIMKELDFTPNELICGEKAVQKPSAIRQNVDMFKAYSKTEKDLVCSWLKFVLANAEGTKGVNYERGYVDNADWQRYFDERK